MSTTRISVTVSGIRFTFVRIRSSSSSAVSRGRNVDLDRTVGRDLVVHELLDARREAFGQRVELEVHARFERFHVAARHGLAPLVPDDAAQHVHRGVRAHQLVPPLPVDRAGDLVARRRAPRRRACARRASPSLRTSVTRRARRACPCRAAARHRSDRTRCGRARRACPSTSVTVAVNSRRYASRRYSSSVAIAATLRPRALLGAVDAHRRGRADLGDVGDRVVGAVVARDRGVRCENTPSGLS